MNTTQWPELQFETLKDTMATVQLWTQIVGKIRLRKMPWTNHSWHVSLYISPTGFTTCSIPYKNGVFQIDFDFIEHQLNITTNSGGKASFELKGQSVASFYNELFAQLKALGIEVTIHAAPNELPHATPFAKDEAHNTYDASNMHTLWQALVSIHNVFTQFRAKFIGKCSPVHLFWGGFDLAVTRFSGNTAPAHPGGMPHMPLPVMQEAYSHEVSSCGFWPGNEQAPHPVFYAYCYPTPDAFGKQPVAPKEAFYSEQMGEFFLPYDAVRQANNPEAMLMEFLETTYAAAANTGNWDRAALEFDFSDFETV